MSVNVPNPNTYIPNLGVHLVAFRDALDDLIKDATYLNAMGGAAFLQGTPFSLNQVDATNIASTIGAVTADNPTVQAIQAFLASAVTLTGGN